MSSIRTLSAAIAAALLLTIGCEPRSAEAPSASPAAGWPPQLNDYTMTWDAEAGIDVTRGAAVVLRAYIESYYLAKITGDATYLYPGFRSAVEPNQPSKRDGTESLWPSELGSEVWVGTVRHHIMRLDRTQRDVVARACAYTYGSGWQTPHGYGANIGTTERHLNSGIYPVRVGLRATDQSQESLPQRGPERAPSNDVFGEWKVTSYQSGFMTTSRWDSYDADQNACIARADGPPEKRYFLPGGGHSREDFPTLPAVPGWPSPHEN